MIVISNILNYRFLLAIIVIALLPMASCDRENGAIDMVTLREVVKSRVSSIRQTAAPGIDGIDRINRIKEIQFQSPDALIKFYEDRDFEAAWIDQYGFTMFIDHLIHAIYTADKEGLDPSDYHLKMLFENYAYLDFYLKGKRKRKQDTEAFGDFELLLTDAYITYASHLYNGKVCPEDIDPDWHAACKTTNIDFAGYLEKAMEDDLIAESLERLKPRNTAYSQLKEALAFYKRLDLHGIGQGFYGNQPLQVVDSNNIYIKNLKTFLQATGDLSAESTLPESDRLMGALQLFQERHGLAATGFLDSLTINALNAGFKDKIKTLEVNMERWRWLPMDLGEEYLMVNIADFTLKISKQNEIMFESKVVVGATFHRTPVFTAAMTRLVLNPYWVIPESIVENEILELAYPEEFLARNRIEVLDKDYCSVPYDSINWEKARTEGLSYQLRQLPGPGNSLGLVKFVFPNDYLVFIHDTPSKSLFNENVRAFSHGCIRVQQPFELAAYLLKGDPQWDLQRLHQFTQNQDTIDFSISLPEPMPVHILYWTTWIDGEGRVYFREDVYGRDGGLWEALKG